MSTLRMSTPSLKRFTVNSTFSSPFSSRRMALSRSSLDESPVTATFSTPASVKRRAMKRACSTDTQKPRARIAVGLPMTRPISLSTSATRTSLPV